MGMGAGDTPILETFGARLRTVRNRAGISQEMLADRADLDRTYISLLERGKRNPSLVCLARLAAALEVSVAELCDFPEK